MWFRLWLLVLFAVPAWAAGAPRVVIDPGHGGTQEGARGPQGLTEKAVALDIALKLKVALEERLSAQVWLTRDEDVAMSLLDRVDLARKKAPDIFISIHANSMPTRRQQARFEGMETFFLSASASGDEARMTADRENAGAPQQRAVRGDDTLKFILDDLARSEAHVDSSRLAYVVQDKLIRATGAVNRGVHQAPLYVLTGVGAPAVLVEVGYISHPAEGKRLSDPSYQERIARAIAEGVGAFLAQIERREVQRAHR